MRLRALIRAELHFLARYGILLLYAVFTAAYLCLLAALPAAVRETAAVVLIFTDPAAMGLFFMGAAVLFEKSQRVDAALSVSPVTVEEYAAGKVIALLCVGLAVAAVLGAFARLPQLPLALAGTALASVLFLRSGWPSPAAVTA